MSIILEQITKHFGNQWVVDNVSLEVADKELFVLLGSSGSGKSTILRMIAGLTQPTSGRILLHGRDVTNLPPQERGTGFVFQNYSIFRHMTVAENIALVNETGGVWRRVDWRARIERARQWLGRAGASIDPLRKASTLTMPEQQLVEIARAIGADARVVIMDEPTASLGDAEVRRLFSVIASLRDAGVGIVYISHRLDEVFEISDRVTVLRDGAAVATKPTKQIERSELIAMMVGRDAGNARPELVEGRADARGSTSSPRADATVPALELVHVSNDAVGVRDVSLSIAEATVVQTKHGMATTWMPTPTISMSLWRSSI